MRLQWFRLAADSSAAELGLTVLAVIAVLWLCWMLSKYLVKKTNGGTTSSSNNIRILERVSLAQDKGLVIAEICGGVYLLSFSNERVEILKELDRDQLKQPKKMPQLDFRDVLNSTLKGRWNATGFDKKHKNDGM